MRACLIIALLCVPALANAQMTAGLGFSVGLGGTLEQDFESAQYGGQAKKGPREMMIKMKSIVKNMEKELR